MIIVFPINCSRPKSSASSAICIVESCQRISL